MKSTEWYRVLALIMPILTLSACASREPADGPPDYRSGRADMPDAVPVDEPPSRYGNHSPYRVNGKTYHVMRTSSGYHERGVASWYGKKFHGRKTSSGETYDMYEMTAAHKSLPLPTYVEVTNLDNGLKITVKVNDRGPFAHNRIIDLSYGAASRLQMIGSGTAFVDVRAIDPRTADSKPEPVVVPEAEPGNPDPTAVAGQLFVQVGAYAEYDNALRMHQRLLGSGFGNTRVVEAGVDGRPLYRVRVGPVDNVDAYDALLSQLLVAGIIETHLVSGE